MIDVTLNDFDEMRAALLEELRAFQTDEFVTVGIHEDTSNHDTDDITNATLGAIHEFGTEHENGTEHIPARPWLKPGVESGNEEYADVIKTAVENGDSLSEALNVAGVVAVGKVKEYMTNLSAPALKHRDGNPLIDEGHLRASVDYKVQSGEPTEGLE